jgi:cell division inhibitor SepF
MDLALRASRLRKNRLTGVSCMSVMRKAMVYLGLSDEDYEEYGRLDDGTETSHTRGADYSRGTTSIRPLARPEPSGVATLTRPPVAAPPVSRPPVEAPQEPVRVHVIEPIEFGDAQEIGDRLKENQPVIITLTDVDADLARRLIDFCSGSTYVLGGAMERVSKNVFLLTPANVEVPPEEKQRLRERGLYRS